MSLAQYSGMTAKIRAMEGRLFDTADYQSLAAEASVPDAVGYLKRHPGYAELFAGADDASIHREQLEEMLSESLMRDFTKLYRFANPNQRRILSLYFMRFEATFIKTCLRYLYDEEKERPAEFRLLPFFERYSKLDIPALWSAASFEELLTALDGSVWKRRLNGVFGRENTTLFDYEMTLDLTCFSAMWKEKDRLPDKGEIEVISAMFGSKIDMINLQWIYRAKKFYRLAETEIYALLIPIRYKLSESQLMALVRAANVQEFAGSLSERISDSLEKENAAALRALVV